MPVLVPRSVRRRRIAADNHLEFRIRRGRREVFFGINVEVSRMVDRQQPHLIEIDSFFERLHKTETQGSAVPTSRNIGEKWGTPIFTISFSGVPHVSPVLRDMGI